MIKNYAQYVLIFFIAVSAVIYFATKKQESSGVYQETAVVEVAQTKNPSSFIGEVIKVDESWPSRISTIQLDIQMPAEHMLLPDAKPYLSLNSPQGFIKEWNLIDSRQIFELDQEILADQVIAELGIYYCREGNEALCLAQKVRFEIPIRTVAEFQPVFLNYQISDEK